MYPASKFIGLNAILARTWVDIEGIAGHAVYQAFNLHLTLSDFRFEFREVVAYELEYATIGRDILNRCCTFFDGPELSWTIKPIDSL